MASLDGKTAIVTGASSGIGAATARALAAAGARVLGGARRTDGAPEGVELERLDVTDPASCEAFVERALERLGGLDVLVNNAGLAFGRDPIWESSDEDERAVLETNVNGLVRMTRLCVPHIRDGGHVVNLGSVAATWPYENGAVYCASKAAVHAFTRSLRQELWGRAVRVTNVAPGLVETDFSRVRFRGDAEKADAVYADVAMGGPLTADDIAECIVFAVTRPLHVNVDELVVMALAQKSPTQILREQ